MANVKTTKLVEKFGLKTLTPGVDVSACQLTQPEVNRPALQMAGYFEYFDPTRLEIIGYGEHTYMQSLSDERKREVYDRFLSYEIPAVVFARGMEPDPIFLEYAYKYGRGVYNTEMATSPFMAEVIKWLNVELAPTMTVHGVLVECFGEGVLITGESGIGKSEAALELVRRGHRLVTDDVVILRKVSDETLVGSAPEVTKNLIELRGIGIIDIKALFGAQAVRDTQAVDLVIRLEEWDKDKEYDRMGLTDDYIEYLGNQIVCYTVPIRPGRNLAVICESAAVNHRQKKMGYYAAQELFNRVQNNIKGRDDGDE